MRAIVVSTFGGPEVLKLQEIPRPVPARGQVLVRLQRIGVNFSDTERRRGSYGSQTLPWIPGGEGAGVVEEVGEGADPALRGSWIAFSRRRTGGESTSCSIPWGAPPRSFP